MDNNILILAAAATTFTKVAVDMVRIASNNLPSWVSPLLAASFGILLSVLLVVADGILLTPQVGARAILAGILAAGGAVGVTELQRRAT